MSKKSKLIRAKFVIAMGASGTPGEAIRGITGCKAHLGIIPARTENDNVDHPISLIEVNLAQVRILERKTIN